MNPEKLTEFEEKIKYHFTDKQLIRTALTHSSYANEKRLKRYNNNERLEFLGDAVLELISSEYLFQNNPTKPEGDMTRMRASYVCEPTLALCAKEMHLGDYIFLGKGEIASGGAGRDSILSDALEATIGAIYLDGGFEEAKRYVFEFVLKDIEQKQLFHDSKTHLQEIVQRTHGTLSYQLVGESGPDHNKSFEVAVLVNNKEITTAQGKTKKKAEQAAAYQAILKLQNK